MGVVARPAGAGHGADDRRRRGRWSLRPRRRGERTGIRGCAARDPRRRSSDAPPRRSNGSWRCSPAASCGRARSRGSWRTPLRAPPRSTHRPCGGPRCWRATSRPWPRRRSSRAPRASSGSGWRSAARCSRCSPRRRRRSRPPGADRRRGGRRLEARRRAHPGAPRRRRGRRVHAHARSDHRARAGGRGGGAALCPFARSSSTARRSRFVPTDGRGRSRRPPAGRRAAATSTRSGASVPLTPFFFDVLRIDGTDLIDRSAAERQAAVGARRPGGLCGCRGS